MLQTLMHARRISVAALFWPLWGLTAALQLADVASVWLAGTGQRIREANPVLLALAAHYGVLGAALVKGLAMAAGLALVAGFYLLARRERHPILAALCLVIVAALGIYSAAVLWNNVAALLSA